MSNFNIDEFAILTLSSADIDTNNTNAYYYPLTVVRDNAVGTIELGRTKFTWKNINWLSILGDMFYKYDTFKLELVQLYCLERDGTSFVVGSYDFPLNVSYEIRISGLNWVNSSYAVSSNCNKTIASLGFLTNTNTTTPFGINYNNYQECSLKFRKDSKLSNITITTGQTGRANETSQGIGVADTVFPHTIYKFHIYPVK